MSQSQQQPAYVLRKRAYRETSELVDLMTPNLGKLSCVVNGAKRKRSGGSYTQRLQLFQPLVVRFQGRSELKTLIDVEDVGPLTPLVGEAFFGACYANELLLRVLQPTDLCLELFAGYGDLLRQLAQPEMLRLALRRFEWQVVCHLGADLDLSIDAISGRPLEAAQRYEFLPGRGWRGVGAEGRESVSGDWALAFSNQEPNAWESPQARRVLSLLLLPYVGEAPFKSRDFWVQSANKG